ncbi:MAG: YbjN domain-containing protein [Acidimicrobiales bacterium]
MSELSTPAELAELDAFISAALATQTIQNPAVVEVQRIGEEPPSWYIRFNGEAKENYSAEFTLGQRSLHFESYFIPAPEENLAEFYRHLLMRNTKLFGMAFTVHNDDGVYIEGRLPNRMIQEPNEIDRILGSVFAYTEEMFTTAAKIGFASRFS